MSLPGGSPQKETVMAKELRGAFHVAKPASIGPMIIPSGRVTAPASYGSAAVPTAPWRVVFHG